MTREFQFAFGEMHSDNSINDKNNLFENYIPKCYTVKRILISFNCFSEYTLANRDDSDVSANDTIDIFRQILNYISSLVFK